MKIFTKKTFWRRLKDLSKLRRALQELSIISIFLLVFWTICFEMERKDVFIIDAIEIPKNLEDKGYKGSVVAEKLGDAARKIALDTRELSKDNSWHGEADRFSGIGIDAYSPDIVVPGTGVSLRSIIRFFRQEFGCNSVYLRGEIIETSDGQLILTLRNVTDKTIPAVRTPPYKNMEKLLKDDNEPSIGEDLLQVAKPVLFAVNAYHTFRTKADAKTTEDSLIYKVMWKKTEYCIQHCSQPSDIALAYVLRGAAFCNIKKYDKSIDEFKQALSADKRNKYAYNGWGYALNHQQKPDYAGAIEKLEKAIKLDNKYAYAYDNWGSALDAQGHQADAIEKFNKAIRLDPEYPDAYNDLGLALYHQHSHVGIMDADDHAGIIDAIEKFDEAIRLDPEYVDAYNNKGKALDALGSHKEAKAIYDKAKQVMDDKAKQYKGN